MLIGTVFLKERRRELIVKVLRKVAEGVGKFSKGLLGE